MTVRLPTPTTSDSVAWVGRNLAHLAAEADQDIRGSSVFRGGQSAADAALAGFDVTGHAGRNEVWPDLRRGASRLSPYIRHGLLPLQHVWRRSADGPGRDTAAFHDELLWQEYARHLHARLGRRLGDPLRFEPPRHPPAPAHPWHSGMACIDVARRELHEAGWLPNQARMWLASHWTVRAGWDWRDGEDVFFTHLLDGSRAANRLGWQWTVGTGTGRPYGFSRAQVRTRAPGLCRQCPLADRCPIGDWPDGEPGPAAPPDPGLRHDGDPDATAGPGAPWSRTVPRVVWLTAESLGDDDPACRAHLRLPVVFVFDEALLARVRLSAKRLVFLAETLAEIAEQRMLEVHLGDPRTVLRGRDAAVTFAPVPGFAKRAQVVRPAQVHPFPWLVRPGPGPVSSFTAWRRGLQPAIRDLDA